MPLYKVLKEEGVTVDDVEFAKDEVLELEADALNVADLLAEGSIVEVEEPTVDVDDVLEQQADDAISPRHEDEHRLGEEA